MKRIFTLLTILAEKLVACGKIFDRTGTTCDIYKDNIYYNITGENTVEVAAKDTNIVNGINYDNKDEYDLDYYQGDVTIPETIEYKGKIYKVTSIGYLAFSCCRKMTSVTIGNSVTTLGEGAFYDCIGLQSAVIGDSVTTIGEGAFFYCTSLTSVTIPNSVTEIGRHTFRGCNGLTLVTIPESVTYIATNAFYNCTSLTSITCEGTTPPIIDSYTFSYYDATLYVPSAAVEEYRKHEIWGKFQNIIGI